MAMEMQALPKGIEKKISTMLCRQTLVNASSFQPLQWTRPNKLDDTEVLEDRECGPKALFSNSI